MLSLSGTAAGAQRAQIRPTRVKEGGSNTAKRCFRGPHELAFVRSKIFIYPQFASSAPTNALVGDGVLQPAPRSANLDSAFGGTHLFAPEKPGEQLLCCSHTLHS